MSGTKPVRGGPAPAGTTAEPRDLSPAALGPLARAGFCACCVSLSADGFHYTFITLRSAKQAAERHRRTTLHSCAAISALVCPYPGHQAGAGAER